MAAIAVAAASATATSAASAASAAPVINLFDNVQLSNEQIIELCEKIGLVRENKCLILCDKDKQQCLNVAHRTTTDGVPCCTSHINATSSDIAPNAIPCRFVFPAEVELRKVKNTIDLTPKEAQRRCHGISKKANGLRCQNACVGETMFCHIHRGCIDHFIGNEEYVVYCGATTLSGTPCKNPTVAGTSTCARHAVHTMEVKVELPSAMQIDPSPVTNQTMNTSTSNSPAVTGCAAKTTKGTPCSRKGVHQYDSHMYCTQHYSIVTK